MAPNPAFTLLEQGTFSVVFPAVEGRLDGRGTVLV
jgi:hypothetical protein